MTVTTSQTDELRPMLLSEVTRITEASVTIDPATGRAKEIEVTLIRAGFGNAKGNRYYSPKLLEKHAKMFEGSRMYADHLTPEQEKKLGGMPRSLKDLVATLKETRYDSASQSVIGRARITANWFGELVANDPTAAEVSIDAVGTARHGRVQGRNANIVEAFHRARSVDFVTHAGAGGKINAILESNMEDTMGLDLLTVEAIKEQRPDLIDLIVKEAASDGGDNSGGNDGGSDDSLTLDSVKSVVQEAVAEATKTIKADADKRIAIAEGRSNIDALLSKSGLPDLSVEDIKGRFAESYFEPTDEKSHVDLLESAVTDAIDKRKAEFRAMSKGARVTGMGPSGSMTEGANGEDTVAAPLHDKLMARVTAAPVAAAPADNGKGE